MPAIKIALSRGFDEIVTYLIENGAYVTPDNFYYCIKKGKLELARLLFSTLKQ